jgi:hypothetical protein
VLARRGTPEVQFFGKGDKKAKLSEFHVLSVRFLDPVMDTGLAPVCAARVNAQAAPGGGTS